MVLAFRTRSLAHEIAVYGFSSVGGRCSAAGRARPVLMTVGDGYPRDVG